MATQERSVSKLDGGLNVLDAANQIGLSVSPFLRNARIEQNATRNRPGYSRIGDTLTGGTTIKGIGDLGSNLIVNYKSGLYRINPETETTFSSITETITSDSTMNFTRVQSSLYCFNGVDEPGKLVGTTYTEPFVAPASLATATFLPKFGEWFQAGGSLLVAGVPTKLNILFGSKAATAANMALAEDFSGALTAAGDAFAIAFDDEITAIRVRFDTVAIFTKTGASLITGFKDLGSVIVPTVKPLEGGHGCVGQGAATLVEDDIYYLTPKNEIRSVLVDFSTTGVTQTRSLSDEIKPFMNDELDTDQSGAIGYYDRVNKLYKLWVKSKGSSFNDICLVRDLLHVDPLTGRPRWLIDTAKNIGAAHHFGNRNFIGSAIEGKIWEDEVGLADDDSVQIAYEFRTKEFDLGAPNVIKKWKNVNIFGKITTSTSLTAKVFVDGASASESITIDANDVTAQETGGVGTESVAEFSIADDDITTTDLIDFTKRIPIRATGKKLQIIFTNTGTNQHFNLQQLDFRFIPQGNGKVPSSEKL
jgi:hypothetical protein